MHDGGCCSVGVLNRIYLLQSFAYRITVMHGEKTMGLLQPNKAVYLGATSAAGPDRVTRFLSPSFLHLLHFAIAMLSLTLCALSSP